MAIIETLTDELYDCEIIFESDGWSGEVLRFHYGEESPHFQFDITGDVHGNGEYYSCTPSENNYGFVFAGSDYDNCILGISLEHMGRIYDTDAEIAFQACGNHPNWKPGGAFGAKPTDTELRLTCSEICVKSLDLIVQGDPSTYENHAIGRYFQYRNNVGIIFWRCAYVGSGQWTWRATIKTDLPIFRTDADLLEYCQSGGAVRNKILNIAEEPDPEEEYKEQFDFWYVKNKWGHNTRNVDSSGNTTKNYRFYPKRRGICFIKHTPTAAEPYDRILYNYSSYDAKYAAWGEDADEDFTDNPNVTTHFLTKSISFGANDYYTKFDFRTNIPLWNNQQDADDYYNGLKDISEADNYAYISRQDDAILNPDLPGTDVDEATAMRTNGMRFGYGVRLYEITNIELSNLMQEMYNPANVQDIIDGNKLMGANTINAVSGVIYLPFADLSEICELGSLANIKIGSWEAKTAQGKRIISNEGNIDCGNFFYNRTYLDYRDYEPYNLLFVNLPFCGCHQLTISKYLDKTVNVSYNVDVCTGGIVAKLTADGILVDIFEGTCGASRPISATDNNAYINSIVGAITGASASASGSIEGITNSVSNVGKAAASGSSLAAGGAAGVAVGVAGGVAASGVYTAYQVKNAVDNPPQMHRGSLAGNLAYYLNSKPTFIFFTKRSIRPENELETIGYPSGHGGTVGSFSGFLSCSAFKLADGFTGTDEERAEIMDIMRGGIYL